MARGFVLSIVVASACAGGNPPSTAGTGNVLGSGSEGSEGAETEAQTEGAMTGSDDSGSPGGSSGESGESGGPGMLGPCAPGVAPAFPGAQWSVMDADMAGMDAVAIDAFIAATGEASGVLVRCGHVVATWGAPDEPVDWGGVTRAVTSTMLMFAVQEDRVANVDDAIAPLGWDLQGEDSAITFRQVANETSGYGLPEAPGAAWGYNDIAGKLYAISVYDRIFVDGSADAVVRNGARLGPLQFTAGDLFEEVSGAPRFRASPSDAARLGWFWANGGEWNAVPVMQPMLFAELVGADVPAATPRTQGGEVDDYLGIGSAGGGADQTGLGPGIYGFGFWLNPGGAAFPGVPADALVANGHWNAEVVAAVPSLGLVAAYVGPGADSESFIGSLAPVMSALVQTVVE